MADRAEVFEHNQTAFVVDSHLKVMLEEDYLALKKHMNNDSLPLAGRVREGGRRRQSPPPKRPAFGGASPRQGGGINSLSSQIVRQIILPQLEKEVNTGKNFANLRQIFNSVILSSWYKKNLKEALLNQVYANKSKVKGINLNDPMVKQQIYEQYLKAYKKGVFNYIKEDVNTVGETIPRKYFSGGIDEAMAADPAITINPVTLVGLQRGKLVDMTARFDTMPQNDRTQNLAMISNLPWIIYWESIYTLFIIAATKLVIDHISSRDDQSNRIAEYKRALDNRVPGKMLFSNDYIDIIDRGVAASAFGVKSYIFAAIKNDITPERLGEMFGIKGLRIKRPRTGDLDWIYAPRDQSYKDQVLIFAFPSDKEREKFLKKFLPTDDAMLSPEEKATVAATIQKGIQDLLARNGIRVVFGEGYEFKYEENGRDWVLGIPAEPSALAIALLLQKRLSLDEDTMIALKNSLTEAFVQNKTRTIQEIYMETEIRGILARSLKGSFRAQGQGPLMIFMNAEPINRDIFLMVKSLIASALDLNAKSVSKHMIGFYPKGDKEYTKDISEKLRGDIREFLENYIREIDRAQTVTTNGGIDLNANNINWNVRKDGNGVEMNVDPAMIERVRREGIDSLSLVIFRITPVTNIWKLAGV